MRFISTFVITALIAAMGSVAVAELQNVEVGGSIRIRGNYYEMDSNRTIRDISFIEQRTRLNVKADFTDDVTALIELDSYDVWGEDFRSQNYVLGLDTRAASVDDVEVYQAYIEAREMWGTPLVMRVGRQELALGSQWLVGVKDTAAFFTGLSFDALKLSYETDMFNATLMAAKLAENFGNFADNDLDLYGLYLSYTGLEDVVLDAYWLFLRDDSAILGVDSDLHTVGLRGAGTLGAFDFEAEVAYQMGDIDARNIDWDAFGGNLEVGYTFDMSWQPRIYLGFAYLEGASSGDMPFNRLFSNWEYSEFLENGELSNAFVYRAGVSAMPTESLDMALKAAYFVADEVDSGGWWFWSWEDSDKIGLELGLYADYHYTEDLVFRAGYAHFFARSGIRDGARVAANGLAQIVGRNSSDNYHYLFVETELSF